jgi:GntR family transcriptional repressor for pyruvate dehydrogenase complex
MNEADPFDPLEAVTGLLGPLPMQNAGERIADRLVTAIALGEFVPGQRLPPERELAALLNVGRGVVREALQRLTVSGYVTIKRGRNGGTFIKTDWSDDTRAIVRRVLVPERERITQLLDLRLLVESMVARTAAQRRDDSDITQIKRALESYVEAGNDRHSSGLADRDLHLAINRATHNPLLEALTYRIRAEVSLGFGAEPYSPLLRERALHQHPLLAAAVIAGDAALAATLAAEHFHLSEDILKRLISTFDDGDDTASRHDASAPPRSASPRKNPKSRTA